MKRKASPSPATSRAKRARESPDVIVVDDDEDDFQAILARIKEQEESEALARRLQDEWDGAGASSRVPEDDSVIIVDSEPEDDEAMAMRLSREWNSPPPSSQSQPRETPPRPDIPPDEILDEFRDFFTSDRPCSKCAKPVSSPRGYVVFSASTIPPTLVGLLHAFCSSCRTNHCRGCFTPTACPSSCKGPQIGKNTACPVQTCCTGVRAVALFEALGGFDRQYLGERENALARARTAAAKRPKTTKSVGPGGTGYGVGGDPGYGFGAPPAYSAGDARGASLRPTTSRVDQLASHWDEITARALGTFTALLPAPYASSPEVFDLLPHASIGPLLALSLLPELLGTLLRNDSVTDWITRSEIYYAMLGLLRRLADCELTVDVLIKPRWEKTRTCGIEEWMWRDGEVVWERGTAGAVERPPPLYAHFKKLTMQCEAFLAGASQMLAQGSGDGDDGGENVEDTMVKASSLCGDIIAARDDIERAMAIIGSSVPLQPANSSTSKGKARDTAVDLEKTYSQACERLAFKHVSLASDLPPTSGKGKGQSTAPPYARYNYAQMLVQTQSGTRRPADRLHLVKELAVMATCLPPGVWVRVDEVRNDAVKVMIAGPEGTPYAGGLFEFDVFLPLNYPHTPPLVHLRTTGGGGVRFNPNLYANGKVCLSLLGTWPGRPEEQWSSRSTLLQVLVSIQSMILVDAPYYNEPGRGVANAKSAVSIAYNRNVALQTVRWAMVEWLRDVHQHSIWADVIKTHFGIRHAQIRARIIDWAAVDQRIYAYLASSKGTAGTATPAPNVPLGGKGTTNLLSEYDEGIRKIKRWSDVEET